VVVAATKTEVLGSPLPTKPIGWIVLALALWTGVSAFLGIFYFYCRLVSGGDLEAFKQLLEGLILPLGWLAWSAVFLYDDVTTPRLLIVGAGITMIVVTGIVLIERLRNRSTRA
jgi:hypothetical protein